MSEGRDATADGDQLDPRVEVVVCPCAGAQIPEDGVDNIDAATISAPVELLANDVAFLCRYDNIGQPSSGITSASVGALPQTTINVANTLGFPSSGSFVVTSTGGVQTITYTGLGGGGTTFNATANRPLGANVTGGPVHVATALGSGTSGPNNIWAEGIVKAFGILSTPGSAGAAIVNSGSIGIASATLTSSTTINVTMKQPMAGTNYVVVPGTCMASNGGGAQPAKVTFNSVISTTVFTLQLESGYDWSANASNWISFFVLGMQ